ncbi:MAG: hypothetical protein QOE72_3526, partial [Chloroflexota bacterium]|nr:hypothetical protein [Chloroflexota bacterium]
GPGLKFLLLATGHTILSADLPIYYAV